MKETLILESKKIYEQGLEELKKEIEELHLQPRLDIFFIGNNKESEIYVNHKKNAGKKIGIEVNVHKFEENASPDEVKKAIKEINSIKGNGIIIQLPIPKHLNQFELINFIDPKKDVDGITSTNLGLLIQEKPYHYPCTPKGVIDTFNFYKIQLKSKRVCIINRSIIVGKPLFHMLLNENSTVTICHSKTENLQEITKHSDIVICAIGKAKFFNRNYFNENSIVIDVGINRVEDKIYGDVDFDNIKGFVKAITPVPGGIGKLTVLNLLKNTLNAAKMSN